VTFSTANIVPPDADVVVVLPAGILRIAKPFGGINMLFRHKSKAENVMNIDRLCYVLISQYWGAGESHPHAFVRGVEFFVLNWC